MGNSRSQGQGRPAYDFVEPATVACLQVMEQRLAHAGIPKFGDVHRDGGGRVAPLGREKAADLVGHRNEFVRLHGETAPSCVHSAAVTAIRRLTCAKPW